MQYPIEIPWSTITDSNGNASHTEYLGKDGWYNLAVSGQSHGNCLWSFSRNLSFLRPAVGNQIHVPIGIAAPGSRIDITITNGLPNDVVSGLIYGNKANRPQFLTDIGGIDDYAASSIGTTGSQTVIGTLSPSTNGTFPLPPNTFAVGFQAANDVGNCDIIMQGVQSLHAYFTGAAGINGIVTANPNDTSVHCTVGACTSSNVFFYAWSTPMSTAVTTTPGTTLAVNQLSANLFTHVATTVNGTTAIVTPSGNQHIYLWGWTIGMDGATGGVLAFIEEHVSSKFIGELSVNGTSGTYAVISGNEMGADLGAGAGLDLNATSIPAGGRVVASVRYRLQ